MADALLAVTGPRTSRGAEGTGFPYRGRRVPPSPGVLLARRRSWVRITVRVLGRGRVRVRSRSGGNDATVYPGAQGIHTLRFHPPSSIVRIETS